jgi:hypothetical protein
MDGYVDNDDGNCMTDDDIDNNCNGATDDNIDNEWNGVTDDKVDNDGTARRVVPIIWMREAAAQQKMKQCGGTQQQAMNATSSRQTRGKWEERRQRTRGNRASIGQGCALRGRGRVERTRGGGINVTTSCRGAEQRGALVKFLRRLQSGAGGGGDCATRPSRWALTPPVSALHNP